MLRQFYWVCSFIALGLFYVNIANAQPDPAAETRRTEARQMAREARIQLDQVMERIERIQPRLDRLETLTRASNFDTAIAQVSVFPPAERRELDSLIERIFSHYREIIQVSNRYADELGEPNCRRELDSKSQPAYQRGEARFSELRSIPAVTNREQLGSATAYSLFFGTFAHFQIPMVLILCAS